MIRIVLDTNILLISIPKKSKYRPIFDAIIENKLELLLSNEVLSEYQEIIQNKSNSFVADNLAELLLHLPNVIQKEAFYKWELITIDNEDNKFVDLAIAGKADFIVSNDKHFEVLKEINFPKLSLIGSEAFLKLLYNSSKS